MKHVLLAVLVSLTLATPAVADTCYTMEFSAPYPDPYPYSGVKLYSQNVGGGITATFGGVWRRGWDCDQPGLGNTCHPCTGQGHYVPTPNGGPPGRQREDDSGDFANEPSPGAVAWLPSGWDGHGSVDSVLITFSQEVKKVSFWYSSSISYNYWCYLADSCGYGYFCNTSGPLAPNPNPRRVRFISAQPPAIVGQIVLDQPGTRDETGCSGDPLGSACKWTYVEFSYPTGFNQIRLEIGALAPFFMDNLTACVQGGAGGCYPHPCEVFARPVKLESADMPDDARRTSWGRIKLIYR